MTEAPREVTLDTGRIRGRRTRHARVFSGIRYAAPPVGDRRWAAPAPADAWSGVADATKPGPLCPQPGLPAAMIDEDCLFLNVTTPRHEPADPLPVMVWLHGGGFTTGGGHLYDAQRLAAQGNVAVVTINYRLGVFGYFGYAGLPGSGTFGLADQLEALRWVRRNAAAFGADPHNVAVFGQSAGAMSIGALLTSPDAAGLFDRAIMQSGSPMLHWPRGIMFPRSPEHSPYLHLSHVEASGARLADQLGCGGEDAVARLRSLDSATLVEHTGDFANHLAWGTSLLPRHPADAVRNGLVHDVPILSGITRDEMRPFIAGAHQVNPITDERLPEFLANSFGDHASAVADAYDASRGSALVTWSAIATDSSWAYAVHREHELQASRAPVYAYAFADRTAPNVNGAEIPGFPMGAAHAADMPYLFDLGGEDMLTAEQHALADEMIGLWASFAHDGEPSAAHSPPWPRFDEGQFVMGFDERGARQVDFRERHRLDCWRSVHSDLRR
ncbi:carboxylesterase/lipase family protein [Paramicrobacterium agarici]|uniref:Para-nitrobenzyl esterase n=1 Tax=Paramicrobacterium agarici TaxID=630514 RepID=A0A2A9DZ27_9MICO|nr:carboxylesterase family protein [Microbacterium agarici]PFG31853.1 para-nitrobenzyl esterase [Microbacterium agarici]